MYFHLYKFLYLYYVSKRKAGLWGFEPQTNRLRAGDSDLAELQAHKILSELEHVKEKSLF